MEKTIEMLLEERKGIRLDVGCGRAKTEGFVGMDIRDLLEVDIVHDWNDIPWPLPDECVLQAIVSHVLEHVNPTNEGLVRWMNELWRVCKPDAEVALAYPHGRSNGFLQDPTHCNPMNEVVWAYFDPLEPSTGGALYKFYHPKPWRIKNVSWNPSANVEVILVKRREDRSYDE